MAGRTSVPSLTHVLNDLLGQQNVIVIPRLLVKSFNGNYAMAAFTAQLYYWSSRGHDVDGWIYKTYRDWAEELSISEMSVRRIVARLSDSVDWLETDVRRVDGTPMMHYRIDREGFAAWLVDHLETSEPTKRSVQSEQVGSVQSEQVDVFNVNTSTSTEITTKPTAEIPDTHVSEPDSPKVGKHGDDPNGMACLFLERLGLDYTASQTLLSRIRGNMNQLRKRDGVGVLDIKMWLDYEQQGGQALEPEWLMNRIGKWLAAGRPTQNERKLGQADTRQFHNGLTSRPKASGNRSASHSLNRAWGGALSNTE